MLIDGWGRYSGETVKCRTGTEGQLCPNLQPVKGSLLLRLFTSVEAT